ncbi:ChbG/HpnK family deacetylase [Maridesulfovibrio bastinii]|uniref:ChbG/HpnK family deacetylase n=1 Tax=Maridesulfovibrio bastinii TaxID=47157 RepID=UPI00040E14A8|nr:ChbG/HpnK family deacetylase [Maridesulfovibrio bastinii]
MLVVINVDDLGLHPAVRRAVEKLHNAGVVTSSTVLANGPDLGEALLLQERCPELGLGVHMNLLRGRPISNPQDIDSLVDEDGLLLGNYSSLLLKYLSGRVSMKHIEAEWSAQIEYLLDHKVRITHLDSEKHIHAWPGLFSLAGRLARKYGVSWVRKPFEHTPLSRFDKGMLRTRFLQVCLAGNKSFEIPAKADSVWGIGDQGNRLNPDLFAGYIKKYTPKVIEIVCHPGYEDPGDGPLPAEFGPLRVRGQWKAEFDALEGKGWLDLFQKIGATPVNYGRIDPRTGELK